MESRPGQLEPQNGDSPVLQSSGRTEIESGELPTNRSRVQSLPEPPKNQKNWRFFGFSSQNLKNTSKNKKNNKKQIEAVKTHEKQKTMFSTH